MRLVHALLPLRRRTNRTHERAGVDALLSLKRITKTQVVNGRRHPVNTFCRQEIVQRCDRKITRDGAGGQVSRSDQHYPVLIAILKRTEEPRALPLDWTTESKRILLPI